MNYKQARKLFDYISSKILAAGILESDKLDSRSKKYFFLPAVASKVDGYMSSFDLSVERVSDADYFINNAIEVKLNEYHGEAEAAVIALKFRSSDGQERIDYMADQVIAAYLRLADERGR